MRLRRIDSLILTLCLLLPFAVMVTASKCGSGPVNPSRPVPIGFAVKYSAKTAEGITIQKRDAAVSDAEKKAVDEGFRRAMTIAKQLGFKKGLAGKYWIVQLEAPNPGCQQPAFQIQTSAPQYDGTKWDKDPAPGSVRICAAEWVTGASSYIGQCIPITKPDFNTNTVVPSNSCVPQVGTMRVVNDLSLIPTASYYGWEHLLLAANDPARYFATQFHTEGSGHPILSPEDCTLYRSCD